MIPWYERSFGREYLNLYAHRTLSEARSDVRAIVKLISPPREEPLLDLGCGAGRHLLALAELGFTKLVGLDLSEELLAVAAERLSLGDDVCGREVRLLRADMRDIPFEDEFATVLSLFTSFGYFEKDEENEAVLTAICRALRAGGTFLIDYMNRDLVIANLVPRDEMTLSDRFVQNSRCLTDDGRRIEKTTTITTEAGAKHEFHESVRLYSMLEMRQMLTVSGFVHIRSYGSLRGERFGAESARLIMVAEKRER